MVVNLSTSAAVNRRIETKSCGLGEGKEIHLGWSVVSKSPFPELHDVSALFQTILAFYDEVTNCGNTYDAEPIIKFDRLRG